MRTPMQYQKNIKHNIITEEMLSDALFSVNKRAKNWRDNAREERHSYSFYSDRNEQRDKENETKMYSYKDKLLSIVNPVCIHQESAGYERTRIYDTNKDFDNLFLSALLKDEIVWQNSYYDYNLDEEVSFFDRIDRTEPIYRYYLYYEVGTRSFHTPITDPKKYDLEIRTIGVLETEGINISTIISVEFVKKVIALIDGGKYTYVENPYLNPPVYENDDDIEEQSVSKACWREIQNIILLNAEKACQGLQYKIREATEQEKQGIDLIHRKDRRRGKPRKAYVTEVRLSEKSIPFTKEIAEFLTDYSCNENITAAGLATDIIQHGPLKEEFTKRYETYQARTLYRNELKKLADKENRDAEQIQVKGVEYEKEKK